jgi:hypothetical protein
MGWPSLYLWLKTSQVMFLWDVHHCMAQDLSSYALMGWPSLYLWLKSSRVMFLWDGHHCTYDSRLLKLCSYGMAITVLMTQDFSSYALMGWPSLYLWLKTSRVMLLWDGHHCTYGSRLLELCSYGMAITVLMAQRTSRVMLLWDGHHCTYGSRLLELCSYGMAITVLMAQDFSSYALMGWPSLYLWLKTSRVMLLWDGHHCTYDSRLLEFPHIQTLTYGLAFYQPWPTNLIPYYWMLTTVSQVHIAFLRFPAGSGAIQWACILLHRWNCWL